MRWQNYTQTWILAIYSITPDLFIYLRTPLFLIVEHSTKRGAYLMRSQSGFPSSGRCHCKHSWWNAGRILFLYILHSFLHWNPCWGHVERMQNMNVTQFVNRRVWTDSEIAPNAAGSWIPIIALLQSHKWRKSKKNKYSSENIPELENVSKHKG